VGEAQQKVKAAEDARRTAGEAVKRRQVATASAPAGGAAAELAASDLSAATQQVKRLDGEVNAARQALDKASRAAEAVLTRIIEGERTAREVVEAGLRDLVDRPGRHKGLTELPSPATQPNVAKARQRLVTYGIISEDADVAAIVTGKVLAGATRPAAVSRSAATAQPTPFAQALVAQFVGELLNQALAGVVQYSFTRNFVDQRLITGRNASPASAPVGGRARPAGELPTYRDVYHYDSSGKFTGLTRYDGASAREIPPAPNPADIR
jgi:hypothetical protein